MTNTAVSCASPHGPLDPDLLDRMIGAKGDATSITVKCQALQSALGHMLSAAFEKATGVEIEARPGDIQQGRRRALLADLSRDSVYCEASISGWSRDIASLCGTKLIIGLVECLLGGSDPNDLDIVSRPLSGIELDMSLMVFEQLNDALHGLVSVDPKARASVAKPSSDIPAAEDDPTPDFHAVAIGLDLEFGAVSATLTLILSQEIVLKMRLKAVKPGERADAGKDDWTARLSDRVSRSEISLQAAVALQALPLGDISRLQPGDLIGFAARGDIEVTLSANGKPLYRCALGRAGARYMVKIEGPAGPDESWKSDFA